jgi:hypothetical protein
MNFHAFSDQVFMIACYGFKASNTTATVLTSHCLPLPSRFNTSGHPSLSRVSHIIRITLCGQDEFFFFITYPS